ncbi:MAG: iron transporter [Pirellula sp.]|nr:iron transporter [Pirellula sp.]
MSPRDPYALDPSLAEDPPASWSGRLKYLGPGLVLTASIVGSGELIATTSLGARAGFTALWIILVSCAVKVALQLQFGRHTILTGETCLTAFNKLPGPSFRGAHWTIWCWLLIQPLKMLQMGGIVGGVAMVLNIFIPSVNVAVWCWVVAVVAAMMVSGESYRFIERVCVALVVAFTATTLISVFSLQWTEYAVSGGDFVEGLRFKLPADLMIAMGAFGLTGVGGDEIMQYTYWLIEKGYAARTGPRIPGDPAWERRARGWINVMYFDALVSMVVYTVITAAFYLLGAAVLHARGETPEGYATINTLALMYTESLGEWARSVFMIGAFAVLFSTVFSALAAWTRVFTDAAGKLGMIDFLNVAQRRRTITLLAWFFPLAWATIFLVYKEPVIMVTLGGMGTAAILLVIVFAAVNFRYRREVPEMRPGRFYDLALWISIAAIVAVAIYGAQDGLRKWQNQKPAQVSPAAEASISAKTQADDVKTQAE